MSSSTLVPAGEPGRPDPAEAVRAALAEALGSTEVDVVAEVTRRMPSGEEVRLVHAVVPGEPNRTASLAVDAAGRVHSPRRLEAIAGRDLFAPVVDRPGGPPAAGTAVAEPITVDPAGNELTLPECATERETVTVHVPPSGVPAKADVYLLADTTGSMGVIIGAVRAGINAVVTDPAFAGLDVAWGAGNYKDFPVPAASPYAFQHQLAPTPGAADVAAAVATWFPSHGADAPEGQLYALQQVAMDPAIGWRPGSKRIVVWFGDAPGHDPVCAAISGGQDVTEATATAALVAAGITVVAVSTDTGVAGGLDGDPIVNAGDYAACGIGGSPGQATRISAATPGGSHSTEVDAASIVATLIALIAVTTLDSRTITPRRA